MKQHKRKQALAQELAAFRKRHGLTHEAFGALDHPVAMMTLYRIETGQVKNPNPATEDVMRRFMKAYNAKHRARRAS